MQRREMMTADRRDAGDAGGNHEQLARALGLFSLGLGAMQIAAPEHVARMVGVRESESNMSLMRAIGLREIVSGIGVLAQSQSPDWLWLRAGGDAMDMALLARAHADEDTDRDRVSMAMVAVAGIGALDVICAQGLSQHEPHDGQRALRMPKEDGASGAQRVRKTLTINCPAEHLYQFWRNFENLPHFMTHLESVKVMDDRRSHWVARGPVGTTVEWDAEITEDRPNELIAWRSLEGAQVPNMGSVRFAPGTGNRGTVVHVDMLYSPPAGAVGATVAKLLGQAPEKQVPVEMQRFKQLMETGEVARTEGQPAGRDRSTSRIFDDFLRQ